MLGLDTRTKMLEPALKQLEDRLEDVNKKLQVKLDETGYGAQEIIEGILKTELDTRKLKSEAENFFRDQAAMALKLLDLQKDLGERQYDEEKHRQISTTINSKEEEAERKNREIGSVEKSIANMQDMISKRKELEKEQDKLLIRGGDISVLKSMFRGSGFVNYISSVYLQNLCAAANERFYKLTRQSLSLELGEDNNFQVRDYLNGGKLRSVKTLSGGQTFQASLSLALSLAGSIRNFSESGGNFFFLDEGFGTLDKDSLDIVFDTLKSLRKENRIVGVISHVDDMQQEIETYLRVNNDPEKGSLIKASWNS
jgi:DNA repair protein SbcC/Rad50